MHIFYTCTQIHLKVEQPADFSGIKLEEAKPPVQISEQLRLDVVEFYTKHNAEKVGYLKRALASFVSDTHLMLFYIQVPMVDKIIVLFANEDGSIDEKRYFEHSICEGRIDIRNSTAIF